MPYKFEDAMIKLPPALDRRRKLSDEEKAMVVALHTKGVSIHDLARIFKVSRRLIQFVLFPDRHEAVKQAYHERGGWRRYYNREEHRVAMMNTRHYKQNLMKAGALCENKSLHRDSELPHPQS